jgi:hypothetical protein
MDRIYRTGPSLTSAASERLHRHSAVRHSGESESGLSVRLVGRDVVEQDAQTGTVARRLKSVGRMAAPTVGGRAEVRDAQRKSPQREQQTHQYEAGRRDLVPMTSPAIRQQVSAQ